MAKALGLDLNELEVRAIQRAYRIVADHAGVGLDEFPMTRWMDCLYLEVCERLGYGYGDIKDIPTRHQVWQTCLYLRKIGKLKED